MSDLLQMQPPESTTPTLPSISRSGPSSRSSAVQVNNLAGFVCCDNTLFHSYDSSYRVKTPLRNPVEKEMNEEMLQRFNSRRIATSLLFESQLYSATNHILKMDGQQRDKILRNMIHLSSADQVAFIKSVVASQKGKFASLMNSSKNEPISIVTSNQYKWRFRAAAEVQSLSLSSDKLFFKKDLEKRVLSDDSSLINWYHSCNGLERREFIRGLISQLDLGGIRLFTDLVADLQYRDFLLELPPQIVMRILELLDGKSRAKLSMVNHKYYQLLDSLRSSTASTTVTRLIELDNPILNIPSYQKAFLELQSRENFRAGKFCRVSDFEGHQGRILCVTVKRNYIASGGSDKTVRVWSVGTGRLLCTLTGHQAGVWCLQFFAKYIIFSGSYDGCIRLWSIKRGRCLRELKGHLGPVWSIKVDGNYLLSGSQDKQAILWDAVRGEPLHYFTGHKEAIFTVDLCCTDLLAVTGSADRTVRLWSIEDGKQLRSLSVGVLLSVTAVAYSRGFIAAASAMTIKIFQLEDVKPIVIPNKSAHETTTTSLVRTQRNINIINHKVEFEEEHTNRIESLTFRVSNPNSHQLDGILITSSKDGFLKYWDLSQKFSVQTFKPLNGGVINCVYFDAYRVAVAGENNKVRLYDFSMPTAALNAAGFAQKTTAASKKSSSRLKRDQSKISEGRSVTFLSENP